MCLKTLSYGDCSPTSHKPSLYENIHNHNNVGFIIYKICELKEMKIEVNIPFTIKLSLKYFLLST